MASKANGGSTKAQQNTAQRNVNPEGAASAPMTLKELQDLERELQGSLIQHEHDIYVTETKYIRLT